MNQGTKKRLLKHMFFDDISPGYDHLIQFHSGLKASVEQDPSKLAASRRSFLARPLDDLVESTATELIAEQKKNWAVGELENNLKMLLIRKAVHEKHAHCFWINALTEDSLLNRRNKYMQFSSQEPLRLPYPFMFFELEDAIDLDLTGLIGRKMRIKGLSFANYKNLKAVGAKLNPVSLEDSSHFDPSNCYEILLHYADPKQGFEVISFDVNQLPVFTLASQNRILVVDPREKSMIDFTGHSKIDSRPFMSKVFASPEAEYGREVLAESPALSQIVDLVLNTIYFTNAENVNEVRVGRETRTPQELMRINKKRIAKGQSPFTPMRPYYIIEVVKHIYDSPETDEERHWTLNWRVWVRGHNWRYRNREKVITKIEWIEPHVRGPPNAPWKHNRYAVLYDRFGHLLNNPTYRKKD